MREGAEGEFDRWAGEYDATLDRSLTLSGEGTGFFARGRVAWLAGRLSALGFHPTSVLDYGCGTGNSTPLFFTLLGCASSLGLDVSDASLRVARARHGGKASGFGLIAGHRPAADFDLTFCNGVFHHIPPAERATAVGFVRDCLKPGGLFAFWDNNPLNPGARYSMSVCAFDREAVMIRAGEAKRLLRSQGFEILGVDYCFLFPRLLAPLRRLEPLVCRLPLGAQYQVLCRKPS